MQNANRDDGNPMITRPSLTGPSHRLSSKDSRDLLAQQLDRRIHPPNVDEYIANHDSLKRSAGEEAQGAGPSKRQATASAAEKDTTSDDPRSSAMSKENVAAPAAPTAKKPKVKKVKKGEHGTPGYFAALAAAARGEGALPLGELDVHVAYIQLLDTHARKQAAIHQADVQREANALHARSIAVQEKIATSLSVLAKNAAPDIYDALVAHSPRIQQ